MRVVASYKYSRAIVEEKQYAIIRNGDKLERVRLIEKKSHPIVWEDHMPMTMEVLNILKYEVK